MREVGFFVLFKLIFGLELLPQLKWLLSEPILKSILKAEDLFAFSWDHNVHILQAYSKLGSSQKINTVSFRLLLQNVHGPPAHSSL